MISGIALLNILCSVSSGGSFQRVGYKAEGLVFDLGGF
jgi:hypothetical protein